VAFMTGKEVEDAKTAGKKQKAESKKEKGEKPLVAEGTDVEEKPKKTRRSPAKKKTE